MNDVKDSQQILELKNVSKTYLGNNFSVFINSIFNRKRSLIGFNVLENINFKVAKGDSIAILGINGSGKSTLLQLISGIIKTDTGQIVRKGQFCGIHELGTAFTPSLTGVENIMVALPLLNISRIAYQRTIKEIIEFADIGDFINKPIFTYSSGMKMRLAFSIATSCSPDLMIIDEALAVGDAKFQRKCQLKIKQLQTVGCTFLIATHSLNLASSLCSKCIIINDKKLYYYGQIAEGIKTYEDNFINKVVNHKNDKFIIDKNNSNEVVKIFSCRLIDNNDVEKDTFKIYEEINIELVFNFTHTLDDPHFGVRIYDHYNNIVFGTTTYDHQLFTQIDSEHLTIKVKFCIKQRLRPGQYHLSVGCASGATNFPRTQWKQILLNSREVKNFEVIECDSQSLWEGSTFMDNSIIVER